MNGIKMGDQVQPMVRCNPGSRWAFCTSPCYRPRSARTFPSITLTSDLLSLKLVQRENVGPNVMFNVNPNPMYVHSIFTSTVDPYPWSGPAKMLNPLPRMTWGTLHGLVGHGPFTEASEGQTCSFLPSEEATGNVACRWIFQATRKLASENARHQRMIGCLAFSFLLETEKVSGSIVEAKNTTAICNVNIDLGFSWSPNPYPAQPKICNLISYGLESAWCWQRQAKMLTGKQARGKKEGLAKASSILQACREETQSEAAVR